MFCQNATEETEMLREIIFSVFGKIPIICADGMTDIVVGQENATSVLSYEKLDVLIANQTPAHPLSIECEAAVINTDDLSVIKSLSKAETEIVTYGFNRKASVTASSVSEDSVVFCVQRSFRTLSQKTVMQQEFSLNISFFSEKFNGDCSAFTLNCVLPAVVTALLADKRAPFISASFNRYR
jgi:hypothetical protein